MTLPKEGFPSAVNIEVGPWHPGDIRAAATYVTDQLGRNCDDILEALGMLTYYGHDTRPNYGSNSKPKTIVTRPGMLQGNA